MKRESGNGKAKQRGPDRPRRAAGSWRRVPSTPPFFFTFRRKSQRGRIPRCLPSRSGGLLAAREQRERVVSRWPPACEKPRRPPALAAHRKRIQRPCGSSASTVRRGLFYFQRRVLGAIDGWLAGRWASVWSEKSCPFLRFARYCYSRALLRYPAAAGTRWSSARSSPTTTRDATWEMVALCLGNAWSCVPRACSYSWMALASCRFVLVLE